MKRTTLEKEPELYGEVINLIEEGFNYPQDQSYAVDFYPLVERDNWNNCHILIDDNGHVAAHVGASQRKLSTDFPITLLGGIVVAPSHRGEGLLSQLLKAVIDHYLPSTTFYVLWSDLDQLYQKYNFHQAGQCVQTGGQDLSQLDSFERHSLHQINDFELDTVKKLYRQDLCNNFLTLKRSDHDWEQLKGIKSTQLYLGRDHNGQIDSYFFYGKGADLGGIIHEFAALPQSRSKRIRQLSTFRLWLPHYKGGHSKIFLGLFRHGSKRWMQELLSYISDDKISFESATENEISFILQNQRYQITMSDFWPLLIGPSQAPEFRSMIKPLYFSGLDTI